MEKQGAKKSMLDQWSVYIHRSHHAKAQEGAECVSVYVCVLLQLLLLTQTTVKAIFSWS